ncbi:MAG: inositol monophosphatase [Gemmatimonadales bacterium]|nr:inositol monophosphatase [Gemmatimonadales bacterium]
MAAAERAAAYLREAPRPDSPAGWTQKAQRDFVTEVDRTSERLIGEVLRAHTPAARIVGEELAPELVRDGLVWVVDPLDGTTNFLHGIPLYAVSIAAVRDGLLEAAVVLDVPHGERFEATRGGGAHRGGERLHVSRIADPAFALVGTGFPFRDVSRLAEYQRHFGAIAAATAGMRRPGAAAIDLAWVAAGRYDGFWELRLAPWDIAAGVLLVREAGGVCTDLAGNHDVVRETGLVAGNPVLHDWLLQVVRA